MSETQFNSMQTLKRRMFAMRNGVLADTLRKAGCPRRIIFGLNLPQLKDIATEYGRNTLLALALFDDINVRESQLLASMIIDPNDINDGLASRLAQNVKWPEEADILCNKLLRYLPGAPDLADNLCRQPDRMHRYTGLRLWLAITCINLDEVLRHRAVAAARDELSRTDSITSLATQIIADNDY